MIRYRPGRLRVTSAVARPPRTRARTAPTGAKRPLGSWRARARKTRGRRGSTSTSTRTARPAGMRRAAAAAFSAGTTVSASAGLSVALADLVGANFARTRVLRRTGSAAENVPSSPVLARATVTQAPLGPVIWIETVASATGAPSAPASVPETLVSAGKV